MRNRQPLGRALVGAPGWAELPDELRQQVADELNVHGFDELAGELVDRSAKGNFRALGKRFGKRTPTVAAAVAAADAGELAAALRATGRATVVVDGEDVEVTADEVLLTETPREGWAVATDGGETVALDLEITPELRRAGLAREVVRLVQEARKTSGLQVTDRVELRWAGDRRAGRGAAGARRRWSPTRCWRPASRKGSANGPRARPTRTSVWPSRSPGRPSDPVKVRSPRGQPKGCSTRADVALR